MSGPAEHHTVTVPLEGWRQVLRRVRQLEALDSQQREIIGSLVAVIDAMPADEAGDL